MKLALPTQRLFQPLAPSLSSRGTLFLRGFIYVLCISLVAAGAYGFTYSRDRMNGLASENAKIDLQNQRLSLAVSSYRTLQNRLAESVQKGIMPAEEAQTIVKSVSASFQEKDFEKVSEVIAAHLAALDQLIANRQETDRITAETEARKGVVSGIVSEGATPLAGVSVTLLKEGQPAGSATTSQDGKYELKNEAGTYALKAELGGYHAVTKEGLVITAQQTVELSFGMGKIPVPQAASATPKATARPATTPKPSTSSSTSDSTAHSSYSRTTVSTSRGTFTADLMTFDLGSGHIKVVADTANDSDCTDGCPVRSVKSFVERNGGFAGINGTYFCPTSYADCAGKTNSFYWKVLNSRLGKMMNADNKLGEEDPFYAFSSTGKATFYTDWVYYGGGGYAGISSKPLLIKGGGYAVKDDHLDSNQKTAKVQRAALGLKGQTFYVVVIQSATVYDLAYVMQELGVDNAMNIDGGGSTAMSYKGIMRRGPGRDVPNALIFVEN